MQPCVHTPIFLSLRRITRVVEESLMFDNLPRVVIDLWMISLLAPQLSRHLIFPLLVSLRPWELESWVVMWGTIANEALVNHLGNLSITTLSLLLQALLEHILVVRLVQMWIDILIAQMIVVHGIDSGINCSLLSRPLNRAYTRSVSVSLGIIL